MGIAAYNRGTKAIRAQFDREAAARPAKPIAAEIMATRRTCDGKRVDFWTDGAVTIGHFHNIVARRVHHDIAWIIAGEVCVYDLSELKGLIAAARKAHDKHVREPHRVRHEDLLRLTRFHAIKACPLRPDTNGDHK